MVVDVSLRRRREILHFETFLPWHRSIFFINLLFTVIGIFEMHDIEDATQHWGYVMQKTACQSADTLNTIR